MGSQVLFYFFHWVEVSGNGGPGWVDKYVDSWINVSGSMLGALKGLPAVLSGEMKDTAQLNAFAVYGLEKFLGKDERVEIFRSMVRLFRVHVPPFKPTRALGYISGVSIL